MAVTPSLVPPFQYHLNALYGVLASNARMRLPLKSPSLNTDLPSAKPPPQIFSDLKRDGEVWYDDGSVVIISGETAFRLYQGVLSAVSPIFGDMFSLPQPQGTETMYGCPVVHMSDPPSELRHFFRVVMRASVDLTLLPLHGLLDQRHKLPFSQLAATIRIAHKYQADKIVDAAGSRLRRFFTGLGPICTEWPAPNRPGPWADMWAALEERCGLSVPMTGATGVEAVNLARLLGHTDVLPFALFLSCSGTGARPGAAAWAADTLLLLRDGVGGRAPGTVERLSDEDYVRCVRAIPELARAFHGTAVETMRLASWRGDTRCAQAVQAPGPCQRVLADMERQHAEERFEGPLMDGLVWFGSRRTPPKAFRGPVLCQECAGVAAEIFRNRMRDRVLPFVAIQVFSRSAADEV